MERENFTPKRKRATDLLMLTTNINKFCTDNDIRLGQLINILEKKYQIDLFNVENSKLDKLLKDFQLDKV